MHDFCLNAPPRPPNINPPPPKEEENSFDEPAKINISSIRRENSTPIWQLLNSLKLKILFQYHMLTQNHDNNLEIFHRNISWTKGTETKVRATRDSLGFVTLVWSLRNVRKLPVLPTCLSTIIYETDRKTLDSELGRQPCRYKSLSGVLEVQTWVPSVSEWVC